MNDFWCASYEFFCLSNFLFLEFILVFFYFPMVLLTYFFIYHVTLLLMMSYLFIETFKYPHLPFTWQKYLSTVWKRYVRMDTLCYKYTSFVFLLAWPSQKKTKKTTSPLNSHKTCPTKNKFSVNIRVSASTCCLWCESIRRHPVPLDRYCSGGQLRFVTEIINI